MNPLIRKAVREDLNAWAEMREQQHPNGLQVHLAELAQYFGNPAGLPGLVDQAWVAVDGASYLGFIEASIRPGANGCDEQPVAFLEDVWVEESVRRSGLGRKLLQVVEAWAREKGMGELGSDALMENLDSLKWHAQMGFEEMERVVCFRKKLK